MTERERGRERKARSDLERVTIFRNLASEYLELIDAVGMVQDSVEEAKDDVHNRTALSLRLMLERKFVTKEDTNTHIPTVINSLSSILDDARDSQWLEERRGEYDGIISGASTGASANFNNVELNFAQIRKVFAYGRLMHSDRDKYVSSIVLSRLHFNLLHRQSTLLVRLISSLHEFVDKRIDSGTIPHSSDSLAGTWHDVCADPEVFELGKRMGSNEIPSLRDDGSQPLPGGPRVRTVSFITPGIGDPPQEC